MKVDTKIQGIEAEVNNNILVIHSKQPLKTLSSAIYNGGLREANAILNIQVPVGLGSDKNDFHLNPDEFLNQQVEKLSLPKDKTIALMTAAKMQNLAVCNEMCGETALTVLATAGKTVAVTAGEPTASKGNQLKKLGTINIIVLIDGNLTDACMVETIKTMTEAKTVALRELDLRSQFSGDIATGTLTDSVAVGCTQRGEVIQYAGTFTLLGELIGKCVRKAVKEAMYKQEKLASGRPLRERLSERGLSTGVILGLDSTLSRDSAAYRQLEKQVELLLSDQKIAQLIIAGLRLDEDAAKGLIPSQTTNGLTRADFNGIVEDLLLQNYEPQSPNENASAVDIGLHTKRILMAVLKSARLPVKT
jgi:adenosylcobinamide hydrolase